MHSRLLVFTLLAAVALCNSMPNFKKMRIKALRQWMDENGLQCPNCVEKEDFIRFCEQEAKLLSNKPARTAPPGTFWESWAQTAGDVCAAMGQKTVIDPTEVESVCSNIRSATDAVFMQHGKRVAMSLRKSHEAVQKTSSKGVYFDAGRRLFTRLVKYCLQPSNVKDCSSMGNVVQLMEKEKVDGVAFMKYITNVGIENTNVMYEILGNRKGLDHHEL